MTIYRATHPGIFRAYDALLADNLGPRAVYVDTLTVDGWSVDWLARADAILSALTDTQLETMAAGEDRAQARLARKSPGHRLAHRLLAYLFERM